MASPSNSSQNGGILGVSNKTSFGKCTVTSKTSSGNVCTQPGTRLAKVLVVAGGAGGGGAGGNNTNGTNGTANTGGGGGGARGQAGNGGDGVVIIRYKYQ